MLRMFWTGYVSITFVMFVCKEHSHLPLLYSSYFNTFQVQLNVGSNSWSSHIKIDEGAELLDYNTAISCIRSNSRIKRIHRSRFMNLLTHHSTIWQVPDIANCRQIGIEKYIYFVSTGWTELSRKVACLLVGSYIFSKSLIIFHRCFNKAVWYNNKVLEQCSAVA